MISLSGLWSWAKSWFTIPHSIKQRIAGEIGDHNQRLIEIVANQQATIQTMNIMLGQLQQRAQATHYEKLVFIGAVALQNGGTFVLPRAFLDTISEGDYRLDMKPDEDTNLVVTLKTNEAVPQGGEESVQNDCEHCGGDYE